MTSQRTLFLALSLSAAVVALGSSPAQAQSNSVIHLHYGSGSTCDFITTGISISGANASNIDTAPNGEFDFVNSDCPMGGGGSTNIPAVSIDQIPLSINENENISFNWHATSADVCRFDGSALPGQVAGWEESGYACVGAADCEAGGNINQGLSVSGTYKFSLTCLSAAYQAQPQTAFRQVQVNGTAPPPNPSCVAPAGITQQTTATLADMSGYPIHTDVAVVDWLDVFGFTWQTTPPTYYGWPGVAASGTKLYVNKNQYLALHFTVPQNYPRTSATTGDPRGSFKTNASAVTNGVNWSISITPDCGDFTQPAFGQPGNKCYAQYSTSQGDTLVWVVTDPNTPISGFCNLNPGESYYLNIIAAPLSNPTQSNCTGSVCKVNFQQGGTISSGPLLP